jgi:hypothetical protein
MPQAVAAGRKYMGVQGQPAIKGLALMPIKYVALLWDRRGEKARGETYFPNRGDNVQQKAAAFCGA